MFLEIQGCIFVHIIVEWPFHISWARGKLLVCIHIIIIIFARFSFKDQDEMEIGCSASSPLGQAEAKFDIEGEKYDTIKQ